MQDNKTLHIYTRVSTAAQKEKGTSLDTQRALGIKAAKRLGLEYKVWNEGDASSNYEEFTNRPELMELLRQIKNGEVKHVWVYNNDRLSRNEVAAQTIRAALKRHNVKLYTKDGAFDFDNPQDSLMKTILDGIAAFDNALRADRSRLGKLSRIKQGYWMGGPPPFGYTAIDKRLELHPEQSKWVKSICEWYAVGKPIHWIKSELERNGIKTNRGNARWTLGSIQKILKNTHPIGTWEYTDSKTDEKVTCICPAIISTSLWNSCQKQRKKTLERKGQNNRTQRFYLLRNFMYCGHCGSPMAARTKESKNEYLYYCPRKERQWVNSAPRPDEEKWKRGQGCTMTKSLNIHRTDDFVWQTVIRSLFEDGTFQQVLLKNLKNHNQKEDPKFSIKKAQNTIKCLKKEKSKLIEDIAAVETNRILGKEDKLIATKILENLRLVLRENEAKIEQNELEISQLLNMNHVFDSDVMTPRDVYEAVAKDYKKSLTPADRKRYLQKILDKITVSYDKAANEHELIFDIRLPIMKRLKGKTWKVGMQTQKKTIQDKGMRTPQVDNAVTVE